MRSKASGRYGAWTKVPSFTDDSKTGAPLELKYNLPDHSYSGRTKLGSGSVWLQFMLFISHSSMSYDIKKKRNIGKGIAPGWEKENYNLSEYKHP